MSDTDKLRQNEKISIFTQFCGNFAEFLPIFLHFWAILVTFACAPAPAPRHPINQPLPELPLAPNYKTSYSLAGLAP